MNTPARDDTPAYVKDGPMFIVSGKVSSMVVGRSSLNLLAEMQRKSALAAAVASIAGTGNAASAASLALYDGEDVENIGCELDGHVVVGSNFQDWAIKDGDEVRMVVSRLKDDVLLSHAAMRMEDTWLWMPYAANQGSKALTKTQFRFGGWSWVAGSAVTTAMTALLTGMQPPFLFVAGGCAIATAAVLSAAGIWSYFDLRPRALYAERIFKVMGFKRPEIVNLKPFSTRAMFKSGQSASISVYRLREALTFYNSPSKARAPSGSSPAATATRTPVPPPPKPMPKFVQPVKKQDGDGPEA